jgi:hypothetical protein
MSTNLYRELNLFNFTRKHFLHICVRISVIKLLEVMSTNFYTGLKPFNFISKYFLQIWVRKVAVHL